MSIEVVVTQKCDANGCETSRTLEVAQGKVHGTSVQFEDGNTGGWRFIKDNGWLCPESLTKVFGR